jgi:phosphate transport system ATP-binding protein
MYQDNKIIIHTFNFYYDSLQALNNIELHIRPNEIFTIFGPARSGKTTLLKSLNRLTDLIYGSRHTGTILLDGKDIYDQAKSPQLRRRWNRF